MGKPSRGQKRSYDNGWEVDWARKKRVGTNLYVWARNPKSWQRRTRSWHWVQHGSLVRRGVEWEWTHPPKYRYKTQQGYVVITLGGLTPERRRLATRFDLWLGKSRGMQRGVKEHHIVAAEKYGRLPKGFIVRHVNGNKSDNRPENLVVGTRRDNALDHRTAVVEMMVWRERALLGKQKKSALARTPEKGARARA